MQADLVIELARADDGSTVARGDLAVAPYWCRWDGSVLWIVGSAATPVGEDDISIEVRVGPGVHAVVRSVAATIVYAARGAGTRLRTRLQVDERASLVWQPEPVIVTERARHRSSLVADVAGSGSLVADEVVVFGRSGEAAGRFASTADLCVDGMPLSLTSYDTSTPGWSGPGGTAGAKVMATRIVLAPGIEGSSAPASVDDRTVVLRPEGGGTLVTTLAPAPSLARSQLDAATVLPSLLNLERALQGPNPVQNGRVQPVASF